MGEPAISVVVATRNRAAMVLRLLSALEAQSGSIDFEVVIVDDASTDNTWPELRRLSETSPLQLRLLHQNRNLGAAAARNAGWRAARAPVIAFTDDDCVPAKDWLFELSNALEGHELVQGRTLPHPDQHDRFGPFIRTIDVETERGFYETCNMAYRRSALERVGGFDESFRYPYGEDSDVAWRVIESGGRSTFAASALVFHEIWPSDFRAHLRDKRRREGLVLALKKHPQLRSRRGVFQNGAHAAALVAGVGGVVFLMQRNAIGLSAAGAGGLLYTWFCRRNHPGPERKVAWLVVAPMHFVADIWEIGVLAKASLRYRTLVL